MFFWGQDLPISGFPVASMQKALKKLVAGFYLFSPKDQYILFVQNWKH